MPAIGERNCALSSRGAGARNFRAEILGLSAICSGLGAAVSQIVLHHQLGLLILGLSCRKVGAPLPVVQCAQHVSRGHTLALMRIDRLNIAVHRRGHRNQVLRRDGRVP